MTPPDWALLERELLRANSRAAEAFAAKYLDNKGCLLHSPRRGGPVLLLFRGWMVKAAR